MSIRQAQGDLQTHRGMSFDAVERIADAILYEGYVLYPYRASAAKNRFRWQFGVVAPRPPHDDGEPWFTQTECLARLDRHTVTGDARLSVRVRYLRPQPTATGWLEGVPHAIDIEPIALGTLPTTRRVSLDAGVDAVVTIRANRSDRFLTFQLRLENHEPWRAEFASNRDAMLERSLVGAHLLLGVEGAEFVSLLEPAADAEALVSVCQNRHTWPVLVGDRSRCDLMLSSPIVLYDFPAVAKESRCDLCDGAEIDEILSLRILTMTDEEKHEARATDPRARAILDRVESLTPDALATLHGTMRSADFFNPAGTPAPDEAFVLIGDRRVTKGSKVRLRPNRRADAMDMFLKDQAATVAGVYRDVEDRVYIAVTVDADPAAALHESFGRFFYFDPDEIELLEQMERI
jgi:hypothetical protein